MPHDSSPEVLNDLVKRTHELVEQVARRLDQTARLCAASRDLLDDRHTRARPMAESLPEGA